MARRLFSDMDADVALALGNRADFDAAKRGFTLDSAYFYVANAIRHNELETAVDIGLGIGEDTITLPADFWFPEFVKNATDDLEIEPREVRTTESVSKPAGNPGIYVRWGHTFLFDRRPTAAKAIRVWYTKRPAEPAGTASSVLDSLYDQLIVMFAIKFSLEQLRDWNQAAQMDKAITAFGSRLKVPWRMTRTDHRGASVQVRTR